jgi:hypothetical protein
LRRSFARPSIARAGTARFDTATERERTRQGSHRGFFEAAGVIKFAKFISYLQAIHYRADAAARSR